MTFWVLYYLILALVDVRRLFLWRYLLQLPSFIYLLFSVIVLQGCIVESDRMVIYGTNTTLVVHVNEEEGCLNTKK